MNEQTRRLEIGGGESSKSALVSSTVEVFVLCSLALKEIADDGEVSTDDLLRGGVLEDENKNRDEA